MTNLSTVFTGGIGVTAFFLSFAYMIWRFLSFSEGGPLSWWPF